MANFQNFVSALMFGACLQQVHGGVLDHSASSSSFGKRGGSLVPEVTSYKRATGGVVSNSAVAVSSINNNDGVGAGTDSYTLYCGSGSAFPKKSAWVSFVDM